MSTVAELVAKREALKVEEQRLSEQMADLQRAEQEALRREEYLARLQEAKAYWTGLHGAVENAIGATLKAKGFQVNSPNFTPSDRYYAHPDGDSVSYVGSGITKGMHISFGWVRSDTGYSRHASYTTKITLTFSSHRERPRQYKLNIIGLLGQQRLHGVPAAVDGNFAQVFKAINEKLQSVTAAEQLVIDQANSREAKRLQIAQDLGTPCTLTSASRLRYSGRQGRPEYYTDYTYTIADGKLAVSQATDGKYHVGLKTSALTVDQIKAIAATVNG